MTFKRAFTEAVSESTEKGFADAGIISLHGDARFINPHEVLIGNEQVTAETIILALGTVPAPLTIPGGEYAVDSEFFLDMDELPERIVFIGGWYISFEFTCIAHTAGADVTILHRSQRLLKQFDKDLVTLLTGVMVEDGIKIQPEHPGEAIEKEEEGYRITADGEIFFADLAVNATGRIPDFTGMDLDQAAITAGKRGILVNEYMQSISQPHVFAIGDCAASGMQLAPVADREAEIVVGTILNGTSQTVDYSGIPSSVFSLPPLSRVGLSELEAEAKGLNFSVNFVDQSGYPSSKRIGKKKAACKVSAYFSRSSFNPLGLLYTYIRYKVLPWIAEEESFTRNESDSPYIHKSIKRRALALVMRYCFDQSINITNTVLTFCLNST